METKIEGPYRHGSQWRCRLRTGSKKTWCRSASSPEEARRGAEEAIGSEPTDPIPAQPKKTIALATDPIRVDGPHPHGSGWRCRVSIGGDRVWCPAGRTEGHARQIAEAFLEEALKAGKVSIAEAIGVFLADQSARGNRPSTVQAYRYALKRFFGSVGDSDLASLTARKAEQLYEQLRSSGLSTDSHRNYLLQARTFLSFCVGKGWIRANPLEKVRGEGRRRHGKPQLTLDESRTLYKICMSEAAREDAALAVLLALTMGLRAGEIVSRTVRDLDDRGRVLRIGSNEAIGFAPKTTKSRRAIQIPEAIRPLLALRARSKLPSALLFAGEGGGPHWRDWVAESVRRYCRRAGLPVVCAHSLRGVAATLSTQAGAAAEAVAQLLGHESVGMTRRAYIEPGTIERAELGRVAEELGR